MLLTSSQVSVAISSAIVVFFTAALFFTGYAIQQRTLRDLRAAVQPRPRPSPPQVFTPDPFRHDTTELEDGTIVVLDEHDRKVRVNQRTGEVVLVRPSLPDNAGARSKTQSQGSSSSSSSSKKADKQERKRQQKAAAAAKKEAAAAAAKDEKPLSRAERRKKIREEIQRLSTEERPVYYQRRLY